MSGETGMAYLQLDEREQFSITVRGNRLFGMMHRPLHVQRCPYVLICHGLAGDRNGKHRLYLMLSQQLAQLGVGSVRFDYRGCGESEGEFSDVTISSQLEDSLEVFDWLVAQPGVDTQRMGLFGRSFGGLIAVMTAARRPHIKSIALWAPVYNGQQWQDAWNMMRAGKLTARQRDELLVINGQQASNTLFEELFQVDPERELRPLEHLPMLLIHGEKDSRVVIKHSERYHERRQRCPQNIDKFIRLPESDHDFSSHFERQEALEATLDWFRQTL